VAARSKACVRDCLHAGNMGSTPADCMDIYLLLVLCVVR
jgi:hypothetical protein